MTCARPLLFALAAAGLTLAASARAAETVRAHPELWPAAGSPREITDAKTEARITELLATMSVEEKVGQTIQADISAITPQDLRAYPLGALLAGGNSAPGGDLRAAPAQWVAMIESYRAIAAEHRSGHTPIPILFGIDAVHGHNKIVGATIFPHNIGLGAARDPDLIRRIGEATAEEVAATGVDWTFGPTVAVPRDPRWGRSYEGYAEDPEVVKTYAGPMTLGLQGALTSGRPLEPGHIAGSAKHFLADGGTAGGKDQGDAQLSESELVAVHAQGYPPAIDAGVLTVMTSFSSWNGAKHAGNASLLTDVLKRRLGFQGFVVGDWNAHGQIAGCSVVDCPQAINAGLDMYMAPDSWKGLFDHTLAEVKAGAIPMSRLDDAVRRILRVKVKAGLFETSRSSEGRFDRLGAPDHRALAREAVRKSLVLLKNNSHILPIRAAARVLIAGSGADDIGRQSGGWTVGWQGVTAHNADFPNGRSIGAGIAEAVRAGGGSAELALDGRFHDKPDVAVVVFGETPYAEFQGDLQDLAFRGGDADLQLMRSLKRQGVPVIAVFLSGRPLWTNPELNAADAFVAAWLPGSQGEGVADVLVGTADGKPRFDFQGRLSFSWPKRADLPTRHREEAGYDPLFAYGYGLTYQSHVDVPQLAEGPGAVAKAQNTDRFFTDGHAPSPWTLAVEGQASLHAIDAGAQENARRVDWTGRGRLFVSGPATDLNRQATGDMAILIRYRVDKAPMGKVSLGLRCGPGCGADVPIAPVFVGAPLGQWRTLEVKLSCFRSAGADLSRVSTPVELTADGTFSLAFSEIRIVPNEGGAICP